MTKCEVYVRARLRGETDADAARLAGYVGRTPPRARELFKKARMLTTRPEMAPMLERKVQAARSALQVALEWDQAARIVAGAS